MIIQVLGERELRLSCFASDELEIKLENGSSRFSAIAMFASSLARCTFVVLAHYAERIKITTKHIIVKMKWDLLEEPTRINQITMDIFWPEVPKERIPSVKRASHKCALSNTIKHCVTINTRLFN